MEIKTAGDLLTASVIGWRWGQEKVDGRFFLYFYTRARFACELSNFLKNEKCLRTG